MSYFQPISLCNVIFKLVSKVLANRLKKILGRIISDCQSAFVAKSKIIFLSLLKPCTIWSRNTKGNTTHMALKLDMRKAYNKVEWDYLKALMLKMRFHSRWVDLVMARMSIVSYSIMVKGVPLGLIKPSRGIHQGILSHSIYFYVLRRFLCTSLKCCPTKTTPWH